eukprot:scpid33365/ scgid15383/ 
MNDCVQYGLDFDKDLIDHRNVWSFRAYYISSETLFNFVEVKNAATFIKAHAAMYGIPHPAPLHGRAGVPPVFLPASQTFTCVHKDYVAVCASIDYRALGKSSFC